MNPERNLPAQYSARPAMTAWEPPPGGPVPESHLSIHDVLGILRRNVWLITACVAVTLPIAVWVVRSTEVEYSASAVVRLADTRRAMSGGLINQPAPSVRWNVDPLQSEAVLIRSRATALAVVDSTPRLRIDVSGIPEHYIGDIAVDPEATSDSVVLSFGSDSVRALRAGDADMTAAYGEQIEFPGFAFSVRRRPEANRAVVHLLSREAAGRMVRGGLWAAPRLQTDLIDISYTSLDPRRSLLIANRVAQVYQVLNAENARRESRLQREFLEEQLRVADSLVEASRRELSRFRSRRRGGFAVAAPGYGTSPQELALRVDEMRFDRGRYAELVESLDTADSADIGDVLDAIVATPVIGDNPLVTQAFGQVSGYQAEIDDLIGGGWGQAESNPDVVRLRELKLRAEDKLARAARSALRSAMTQLDARIAALEDFQQDALDRQSREGVLEIEEGQLEAQLANARERADRFRTAYQNARMSEAIEVGQVEIIELAAGALPSRSGIQQKVIMIVGLGVFLGLALAFARERLRTSIRGQEEVSALGLPILGVVPRLASGKNGSSAKDAGPVVEAMRGIRLNLVHTHGAAGTLMTTITSPDPSDGKSFVSANLALAFAHGGERVLLIDGDLRRGSLHRVMGRDRKPGLTDLLTGDAKREQVVRTTDYPGLDFIPCGTRTALAPEVLGSPAMGELIGNLKRDYGVILVDSPPIGAGVDALSLATGTGSLVLVVRSGATKREAAEAKLDMVERLPIRILGAVVNAVKHGESGYSYGYYMPGYDYEEEDEDDSAEVAARLIRGQPRADKLKRG